MWSDVDLNLNLDIYLLMYEKITQKFDLARNFYWNFRFQIVSQQVVVKRTPLFCQKPNWFVTNYIYVTIVSKSKGKTFAIFISPSLIIILFQFNKAMYCSAILHARIGRYHRKIHMCFIAMEKARKKQAKHILKYVV